MHYLSLSLVTSEHENFYWRVSQLSEWVSQSPLYQIIIDWMRTRMVQQDKLQPTSTDLTSAQHDQTMIFLLAAIHKQSYYYYYYYYNTTKSIN